MKNGQYKEFLDIDRNYKEFLLDVAVRFGLGQIAGGLSRIDDHHALTNGALIGRKCIPVASALTYCHLQQPLPG